MRFVDRTEELARLDSVCERQEASFVALWGRRRIGKTRLLLEWCKRHHGIYSVADQSSEPIQRRYFAKSVAQWFDGFDEVEYPSWQALLRALAMRAMAAHDRGPVVIDELPYLVSASPSLPSVLQRFVDHEAKEAKLILAVAGSAQSMMQGLVMDASAPLFGRATEAMAIQPLRVPNIQSALELPTAQACVESHAVWGGVPRYWELAAAHRDLETAVDRLVLDPLGPLHLEPDRLLADDVPPATSLRPLLDAIGGGVHRLSEIARRIQRPATSLSRPLSRLMSLGFVERENPFGAPPRGSKRTIYRIADPFLRFWFRVVAPRRGLLATAPSSVRKRMYRTHRPALLAETWEAQCRLAVVRFNPAKLRSLPDAYGPAARFWSARGPEWDVVSESLDGSSVLLGEVKWHDKPADDASVRRAVNALMKKGEPSVVGDRNVVHAVFVPTIAPEVKRKAWPVVLIDAEDVMEAMR